LIFIHGGITPSGFSNDMLLLDTNDNNKVTLLSPIIALGHSTPSKRKNHSMLYLSGGSVLLYGGIDSSNATLSDLWILTVDNDTLKFQS
jgi:hypothetical protein